MAELVYLLCATTSSVCAALLIRSFLLTRLPLLLWSCLCFVGLALNSSLLLLDLLVASGSSLEVPRTLLALASILMLLYGLIMEAR